MTKSSKLAWKSIIGLALLAVGVVQAADPPGIAARPTLPDAAIGVTRNADPDVITAEEGARLGTVAVTERALLKDPGNATARLAAAEQYYQKSFTAPSARAAAESYVDTVLQTTPNNAAAKLLKGRILVAGARYREAIPVLQEAVRLAPTDPHAHCSLGEALERSGDPAAASVEFAEFRRLAEALLDPPVAVAK